MHSGMSLIGPRLLHAIPARPTPADAAADSSYQPDAVIAGWVMLGGAIGALTRFGITTAIARSERWPGWLGIVVVNLLGCLLIGLAAGGLQRTGWLHALAMTGFCGALTTFSSFALDIAFLFVSRAWRSLALCVALTLAVGPLLTWIGWLIAHPMMVTHG